MAYNMNLASMYGEDTITLHADQTNLPASPNGNPVVRLADGSVQATDNQGNVIMPGAPAQSLADNTTAQSSTINATDTTPEKHHQGCPEALGSYRSNHGLRCRLHLGHP